MHLIDVLHAGLVHLIFGALWLGVDKTNVFSIGDLGPVAASGNNTFDHLPYFTGRNFCWKKLSLEETFTVWADCKFFIFLGNKLLQLNGFRKVLKNKFLQMMKF